MLKLALKFALPFAALFVLAVPAAATIDVKVTVSGLTDATGFTALSFSFGVTNQAAANALTYSGKKGSFSNLSIFKFVDSYSPQLAQACFQGTQFSTVELVGTDQATETAVIDIVMTRCFVSADQYSGSNEIPAESVSFSGTRITINGVPINTSTSAGILRANQMIAKLLKKADHPKATVK